MANTETAEQRQDREDREERELHRDLNAMQNETELEIGRFAFDDNANPAEDPNAPEDDGDRSLEEPDDDFGGGLPEEEQQEDAQDETQDGEPEAEPEQEPEPQRPQRNEQSERFVPSSRLREERDARERAERELAELRMRQQHQPPPPPQQQYQPLPRPDAFADPDGRDDWNLQRTLQAVRFQNIEQSLQSAAEEFGPDYQYVYRTLQQGVQQNDPAAHQALNAILQSPNPGRSLMRWGEPLLQEYQDQQEGVHREWLRERYGIDADQLEQRQQRAGQSGSRQANPPRREMPSLNSAAGNGRVMSRQRYGSDADMTDTEIFNDVFPPIRR